MSNSNIYTVRGSVLANDGLYIPRVADEELLGLCRAGEYAYILTSRQAGKSSLMDKTVQELEGESVCCLVIDLQGHGVNASEDQWYYGLVAKIGEQLQEQFDLETDVKKWWREHAELAKGQRLILFFKEVVLPVVGPGRRVVVFVDEIDTTLGLRFTDDFFASIRYMYGARSRDAEFRRLSFVLIGVATPTDLIRDRKRTPFNIAQRVELADFTFEEALPLADGLGLPPEEARRVLRYALERTGGHPCLTQRLCKAIADEGRQEWSEEGVESVTAETFFGTRSTEDDHLLFVRDMLTKRAGKLRERVLTTYGDVLRGKHVTDDERSQVKSHLKLSGVVRREDGVLRVRNPIYRYVFDEEFVKENNHTDWMRLAARAAAALVILGILVSAVLAPYAWTKKSEAESARRELEESNVVIRASLQREQAARAEAEQRRVEAEEARRELETSNRALAEANEKIQTSLHNEQSARSDAEAQRLIAEQRSIEAEAQRNDALRARDEAAVAAQMEKEAKAAALEALNEAERQRLRAESALAEAERLRQLATGGQLGALAEVLKNQQPNMLQRSAQLAYEAVSLSPKSPPFIGYQSLSQSLLLLPPQVAAMEIPEGDTYSMFAADGKMLSNVTGHGICEPPGRVFESGMEQEVIPSALVQVLPVEGGGQPLKLDRQPIKGTCLVPGERFVVTAKSAEGRDILSAVDILTGKEVGQFAPGCTIKAAAVSSDGKVMAAACADKNLVQIWKMKGDKEPRRIMLDESIADLSLSPKGTYVVTAKYTAPGHDITIRRTDTGSVVMHKQTAAGSMTLRRRAWTEVSPVIFSPEEELVFIAATDSHLFDLATGAEYTPLDDRLAKEREGRPNRITAVVFSSDGKFLAAQTSASRIVQIMPIGTKDRKFYPLPTTTSVGGMAFVSDSHGSSSEFYLATINEGDVHIWELKGDSAALVSTINQGGGIKSVTFSPRGRYLAAASGDTVQVWEWKQVVDVWPPLYPRPVEVARVIHGADVVDIDFSPDGGLLATTSDDKTVRVWRLSGGLEPLRRVLQRSVASYAASPDGKYVATVDEEVENAIPEDYLGDGRQEVEGYRLRVFDVDHNYSVSAEVTSNNPIGEIKFSPDGKYVAASVSLDNANESSWRTIKIFAVSSGGEVGSSDVEDAASSFSLSAGGKYLAVHKGGVVSIWLVSDGYDVESRGGEAKKPFFRIEDVETFAFSPHGPLLALVTADEDTHLFNVDEKREVIPPLKARPSVPTRSYELAFGFNGQLLAIATNEEIQIVRIMDNSPPTRMRHEGGAVTSLVFSPNNEYIASAGTDNTARVWRVSDGRELARLNADSDIHDITFSRKSDFLAASVRTGYANRGLPMVESVRVLGIDAKREVARIPLGGGGLLTFSHEDTYLHMWEGGQVVALRWKATDLLSASCDRLTTSWPTLGEWREYVGDELHKALLPTLSPTNCPPTSLKESRP